MPMVKVFFDYRSSLPGYFIFLRVGDISLASFYRYNMSHFFRISVVKSSSNHLLRSLLYSSFIFVSMCYPFKFALISFVCDMLAQAKWFQAGLISHFFVFQWYPLSQY